MTRVSIHRPTTTPIVAIGDADLLCALSRLPRRGRHRRSRLPLSAPLLRRAARPHLALWRGSWCPVGRIWHGPPSAPHH